MKKFFSIIQIILICLSVGCTEPYDDTEIRSDIEDLQNRVEALEKMCREMNTNISSLQTIVNALQKNDYITGVTPITEGGVTVGYTITFAKSAAITIYHGKDGADGQDGKDGANGKDGYTPQISVKQDADGIYYWTLDGEWLTDANGNKIKAQGTDGKDGANGADGADGEDGKDGQDGANGADGANGQDGITPQLKIEDDYWYVSYDNGKTWNQLGKATGEKGDKGDQGDKGDKGDTGLVGDSMFSDVDYSNEDYVIFTLSNGTQVKVPTWYAFEQLQILCNQMNTNISALQAIVSALQNNDYVTSVSPVLEDGKTIGYTIYFSKSNPVTIYHGQNGKDGQDGQDGANGADGKDGYTPQIGVKQDADGIYYWTLDGEWLTDANGNKIKAVGIDGANGSNGADGAQGVPGVDGKDGITPQLKIENGYWMISYDNGLSWSQLGKATGEDGKDGQDGANGADGKDGDSFFQSVSQDEQFVYFTLADGTVITLPKGAYLEITFDASDLVVMSPNTTREISYTVQSVTENVTVEVTSSADIRAKVVPANASGKSGAIKITTGAVIDEYSKVIVFVANGEKVVMKSIAFEQSGLEISDDAIQNVKAEGGEVSLNFLTNMDWRVEIPASAQSWISMAPQARAMVEHSTTLVVKPNTALSARTANINIVTTDGKLSVSYTILQDVFGSFTATTTDAAGWKSDDKISLFAGNTKNQQFNYAGIVGAASGVFEAATVANGSVMAIQAHYAVSPYSSSYSLGVDGNVVVALPAEQSYVVGGYNRNYNVMVAKSAGLDNTELTLRPVCAYVCVKLWGKDQTIKSLTLTSMAGEAIAGMALVTPSVDAAPTCKLVSTTSSIKINCNEVEVGATEATATEFWFVVPAVKLAQGYSIKLVGFYGGEQTITLPEATTLTPGTTYNVSNEVTIPNNGAGMGVGGWGDGENVEGEI